MEFPVIPTTTQVDPAGTKFSGRVASFSSGGGNVVAAEIIKPDITAPGISTFGSGRVTVVCGRTRTGKSGPAGGHAHRVKPKIESEEVEISAGTAAGLGAAARRRA